MNLETRKIEFIQEFLKIQSEKIISRFEEILKNEKIELEDRMYEPMSIEDLNKRIDQSEFDFLNNRFKNSSELLAKYK